MPTFLEIAQPLVGRGIPVIPVRPLSKRGLFEDQFDVATTDIDQVARWNQQDPTFNVGCVGTPDGIVILDCDAAGLVERIEREMGQKIPRTFTVKSAGKGMPHFYFRQTEMSRAIGNKKAAGQFDLQSTAKYVVGPGSTLDNGRTWTVVDDSPIVEFPEWLAYWVLDNCDQAKSPKGFDKAPSVHEDFDFDEFMEHYDLDYFGKGRKGKHILKRCPVKGDCHTTDGSPDYAACVIFYDGDKLGFNDLATSCEGSNLTIGGLIHWLNSHGYDPYEGVIWPPDKNLLNDPRFAVEDASLCEEEPSTTTQTAAASAPAPVDPAMDAAWEEQAKRINPDPLPAPDDIDALFNVEPIEGLAFDPRALYGKLGEIAVRTKVPLGWAYPGLLGIASALHIRDKYDHVRSNMYVGLIAPPGMAKTAVVEAIEKSIFLPELTKTYITPASDRGLVKMIGEDGNTVLVIEDEFRTVLSKCQVPNSTLAQIFCKLWSKDQAGVADKKGVDRCIGKFCVVGNIPADDAADFSRCFASSTVSGMYDRFLFGYDTMHVKYRPVEIKAEVFTEEMVVRVPMWVWDAKDRWGGEEVARRRLTEHALRVALVTAGVNGTRRSPYPAWAAAFRFVEWQERLRKKFRPGVAETKEAECFEAVYNKLLDHHREQERANTFPSGADLVAGYSEQDLPKFLAFTDIVKKGLYRKYSSMVTRVKKTMLDDGIIEQVKEVDPTDPDVKGKATPFFLLKKSM